MVDRPCRGRLNLMKIKVNDMLKKCTINNNDILTFLHVQSGSQINYKQ